MSSILKALRKLEEEKRRGKLEAPDLRVDQGRPEVAGRPFVPLVIGAVSGIVLVSLIFFWSTDPQKMRDLLPGAARGPDVPADGQSLPVPQAGVEQPVAAAPVDSLPRPSSPASVEPKTSIATTPAVSEAVVPSLKEAVVAEDAIPSRRIEGEVAASTTDQSAMTAQQDLSPAAAPLPAGTSLLVSEIFYLDNVNSMAVVNDLPVMVGSHVDSAVVTEIHADRVLFEIDGKAYAVSLPHK